MENSLGTTVCGGEQGSACVAVAGYYKKSNNRTADGIGVGKVRMREKIAERKVQEGSQQ